MNSNKGTVCVTGAAGFIGSWLVMRLLGQGYTIKATVLDPSNMKEVKHLLDLPHANKKLTLWKADLVDEGSFDEAVEGCIGVFHLATPLDFETSDPENEMIKPTINGMLNLLRSCVKASVQRVVFTSSAGAVCIPGFFQQSVYDENSWTDVEVCRAQKMTGWMYFAGKTLAEKAAWEFSVEHNLDLISIVPTLVNGPFLGPTMPFSILSALALITRNIPHYSMLKQAVLVHVDDVCAAHIFLFQHPEAKGRYICSSHETSIIRLAKVLNERFPEFDIPTEFEGIDEDLEVVTLSSKKLIDLGFRFKYSLEDMYEGAIQTCREKGLLQAARNDNK